MTVKPACIKRGDPAAPLKLLTHELQCVHLHTYSSRCVVATILELMYYKRTLSSQCPKLIESMHAHKS